MKAYTYPKAGWHPEYAVEHFFKVQKDANLSFPVLASTSRQILDFAIAEFKSKNEPKLQSIAETMLDTILKKESAQRGDPAYYRKTTPKQRHSVGLGLAKYYSDREILAKAWDLTDEEIDEIWADSLENKEG